MKKLLLLMGVVLCFYTQANAQTDEKTSIESTIQMYFDGWMTSDTTKLGKAMHSTCHLKVNRNGVFKDMSRNEYLKGFKSVKAKEDGIFGRIKSIDFTGNIASAKCEIETPKAIFTDYFNLIKIENTWYIVDKISTRVDKQK
jgi:Putative lumazine-binding